MDVIVSRDYCKYACVMVVRVLNGMQNDDILGIVLEFVLIFDKMIFCCNYCFGVQQDTWT